MHSWRRAPLASRNPWIDSLRFRECRPCPLVSIAPSATPSSCVKPPITGSGMRVQTDAACLSPVPARSALKLASNRGELPRGCGRGPLSNKVASGPDKQ